MSLKEILEKIVEKQLPILLADHRQDWEANDLLATLSVPMLKRRAHFQPGMYIAEVSDGGYLGTVLFRIKNKA